MSGRPPIPDRRTLKNLVLRHKNGDKEDAQYGPIGEWNVSQITDFSNLFSDYQEFNEDISRWNVSNVTDMTLMFYRCKKFNQPLNNWNVSNVTNMGGMFLYCIKFNQPLNKWNVSNVTDMGDMFWLCQRFNQPLNNWNVRNVIYMENMFFGCTSFNQDISNWVISENTIFRGIFDECFIRENFKPIKIRNVTRTQSLRDERERRQNQQRENQFMGMEEAETRRNIIAERGAEEFEQNINDEYPECMLCYGLLNGEEGPENNANCLHDCKDPVNVCVNNHILHRGCILDWINAQGISNQYVTDDGQIVNYVTPQRNIGKCPICREPLKPNVPNAPRVSDEELKEIKRIEKEITKKRGGRKTRENKRNKTKQGKKRKTHRRKSKKSRHSTRN